MTTGELQQVLPAIASHPFAIIGYIAGLCGATVISIGRIRSKTFIEALKLTPKDLRPDFARNSGYRYDELSKLTQEQQFKLVMYKYILLGFIVAVIGIVSIAYAAYDEIHKKSAGTALLAHPPLPAEERSPRAKSDEDIVRAVTSADVTGIRAVSAAPNSTPPKASPAVA